MEFEFYKGGQLEVQGQGYTYRGEIKDVKMDEGELNFKLNWLAKLNNEWEEVENKDYKIALEIYNTSNIGPGPEGGDDRMCLTSWIVRETTVLFPPNGSKLNFNEVKKLQK